MCSFLCLTTCNIYLKKKIFTAKHSWVWWRLFMRAHVNVNQLIIFFFYIIYIHFPFQKNKNCFQHDIYVEMPTLLSWNIFVYKCVIFTHIYIIRKFLVWFYFCFFLSYIYLFKHSNIIIYYKNKIIIIINAYISIE